MPEHRDSLFAGTLFLVFSNIYVRGLGFFYRVVLMRLLGAEGVGLVEMIMPIYSFLLVLAGLGIPLAMSQKIAEENKKNNRLNISRIFKSGRTLLVLSGSAVTGLSFFCLPWIVKHFAADQRISYALFAILPAVIIISAASAYRGYFQGKKQVAVLGVSQSVEQTVRVASGIFLIQQALSLSIEKTVTAVAVASVIAESAGFIYLLWRFSRERSLLSGRASVFSPGASLSLIRFGAPVTVTRLINSAVYMLQAMLIPLSLQSAGWNQQASTEIYGRFAGVSMTLLHLPGVFTAALTVSVLPLVAESGLLNRENLKNKVSRSLQAAVVFTLPGMLILNLFSLQLCGWIFKSPLAALPLQILSCGGVFYYMQMILASVLQGLGEVRALLYNSIASGICLLGGIIFLTSLPSLGIAGTALAVDICYICGFLLNLIYFYHISHISLPWQNIFFKPLVAAGASVIFVMTVGKNIAAAFFSQEKMAVLAMILLLLIVYFLILLLTKGLSIGAWRRLTRRF